MADTHQAAYASVELTREKVFDRIVSVFEAHQIGFTHTVHGLRWDETFGEFYYALDQTKDNVETPRDAFKLSRGWVGVCLDFRFWQWDFELYLFSRNQRENVVLSFPHSLYKTATINSDIASKWIVLLEDVGLNLDQAVMICGPEARIQSAKASVLFAKFQDFLRNYRRGDYFVHTVLLPRLLFNKLGQSQQLPETFLISEVTETYQLATLLKNARQNTGVIPEKYSTTMQGGIS
jgi:hypothetical protein